MYIIIISVCKKQTTKKGKQLSVEVIENDRTFKRWEVKQKQH